MYRPSLRQHLSLRLSSLCLSLVVALSLLGCQPGPETFATRFDAAVATGRLEAVLPLLTRRSRMTVQALNQFGGAANNPFLPPKSGKPTEVMAIRVVNNGVVMQVRDGSVARFPSGGPITSEWVLRQEDGAWRLDLLATSTRRPLL